MRFTRHITAIGLLLTISLLVIGARLFLFSASANKLDSRSVQLDTSLQGANARYKFDFNIPTANSIGSIRFQFCDDTPLLDNVCNPPTGFDASAAVLDSQIGETGFSVDPATNANEIYLTRSATVTNIAGTQYVFSNIINPSANGTYFVRVQTYATTDGSGPMTDGGGLAFAINSAVDVSATVPPYLLFCSGLVITGYDCNTVSGNYINFGELNSSTTKSDQSQMVVATNAGFGYGIFLGGNTMTSGTSTIPPLIASDVSRPGTSQFGINLTANSSPSVGEAVSGPGDGTVDANYNVADRFRFNAGEQLAGGPGVSDYRKFTVSYIANIAKAQPAGIYVSTLTYICMANF